MPYVPKDKTKNGENGRKTEQNGENGRKSGQNTQKRPNLVENGLEKNQILQYYYNIKVHRNKIKGEKNVKKANSTHEKNN